MKDNHSSIANLISINNAGLVLFQPYFQMLFKRLGITKENEFVNIDAQLKAVHYLQYLVSGNSQTDEPFLVLNKLLCGLEITSKVPQGIEISIDEEQLMQGLLQSIIQQWTALSTSTIENLRGSFLLRDGNIIENENSWKLTVEQKSYDLLMNSLPYTYKMIKLPWMEKMIEVDWN